MADKVTNYICPACMGSVHFAAETGMIECDYCGSTYSVEEMEKMMAEANASAEEAAKTVDQCEQAQQECIGGNMPAYSCNTVFLCNPVNKSLRCTVIPPIQRIVIHHIKSAYSRKFSGFFLKKSELKFRITVMTSAIYLLLT